MKNTASTTPFAIILQLKSKMFINVTAIEKAAQEILTLETWLNQLRDVAILSGTSKGIAALIHEGKQEALKLKRDIFNAIGTAEFVLTGFSKKIVSDLKECVRNTVLAYKRAQRALTQAMKKEKEIITE